MVGKVDETTAKSPFGHHMYGRKNTNHASGGKNQEKIFLGDPLSLCSKNYLLALVSKHQKQASFDGKPDSHLAGMATGGSV